MNSRHTVCEIDKAYMDSPYQKRLFNPSPRNVCFEIGLNWIAALRLYEGGWLSYDPTVKAQLEEHEETELRFLGALVAWGLDESQLNTILRGLHKPYRYRMDQIYFDWLKKEWQLLPSSDKFRSTQEFIDELKDSGEIGELHSLHDFINDALDELGAIEEEEDDEQ